jgi:tetratricopeptide (TPR) repeat protein
MVLSVLAVHAQRDEELFLHANVLYEQQEWQHALELYQSIERKGSSVWYNMGNCFYYIKDYPHAHAAWKKAERGLSGQWRRACREQQELIGVALHVPAHTSFLRRVLQYIIDCAAGLSLIQLQLLLLCAWYSALLFSTLAIRSRLYAILRVAPMSMSAVCAVLLIAAWYDRSQVIAIVCSDQAALFAGPDNHYETVGNVRAHEELKVCDVRPGWCRVSTASGSGWVDAHAIETVG